MSTRVPCLTIELFVKKNLIPFIDTAYLGFGRGLDKDNAGIRIMAETVPEIVVASSSSKSFGIYRERAGMISLVSDLEGGSLINLRKELLEITRGLYFMSADHGAAIVAEVLKDKELTKMWRKELDTIQSRIVGLRKMLSIALNEVFQSNQYTYIDQQLGMFSMLPLNSEQTKALTEEHSVYLIPDGRINIAGLTENKVDRVAKSIYAVS